MKTKLFVLVYLLTQSFAALSAAVSEENIYIGKAFRMALYSEVLGQTRSVRVHLPASYGTSNAHYPVLYLLDGERHLAHAILATRLYSELGVVPEQIIVAVENLNQDGAREQDFHHNKKAFSTFLGDELHGYINHHYRTEKYTTVFGHSLAARFIIELLANGSGAFDNYIAASPPLQNHVDSIYRNLMEQPGKPGTTLYLSIAAKEQEGHSAYAAYLQFVELLSENAPPALSWEHELMEDESHISNYYITFFRGISKVFSASHNL